MTAKLTKPWHFDKEQIAEELVFPKLKEVFDICQKHNIPFLSMVQTVSGEEYQQFRSSGVVLGSSGKPLDVVEQMLAMTFFNIELDDDFDELPKPIQEILIKAHEFRMERQKEYDNLTLN